VAYRVAGRIAAVASIFRDQDSLRAEALLERGDQAGLQALLSGARRRGRRLDRAPATRPGYLKRLVGRRIAA
jgi:hypothetical protein